MDFLSVTEPIIVVVFACILAYKLATYTEPKRGV